MVEERYLRGNSRNWFWAAAVVLLFMLVWSQVWRYVWPIVFPNMIDNSRMAYVAAGIQTFFYAAAWAVILLAYGLNNQIKVFKIMFLVMAGIMLLSCYGHFILARGRYDTAYLEGVLTSGRSVIIRMSSLMQTGAWVLFGVIVLCHRKTGGLLRAAAVVLIVSGVLALVYAAGSGALITALANTMPSQRVVTVINVAGLLMNVVTYGSLIFLFGAMSFSRVRNTEGVSHR